jgi:hypothetical protein
MRKISAAGTRGDCDILACNLGAGECDSSRRGRDGERAAPHRPGRRSGPTLRGITQGKPRRWPAAATKPAGRHARRGRAPVDGSSCSQFI